MALFDVKIILVDYTMTQMITNTEENSFDHSFEDSINLLTSK